MNLTHRAVCLALASLGGLGLSGSAHAADDACFDAYEKTQRLRNNGKLTEARDQALLCARPECPALLKKDCAQWSDEIGRTLATVVFSAKDEKGQELATAAVYVDDRKVADAIDGKPVTLDPGAHKVRFESGNRTSETIIQVGAGESNRRVEATLTPPAPAVVAAPPAPPPPLVHRIPTPSLILGGVAGVGLVSFISFAVAGRVEQGCSPTCSSHQVSTLRAEYAVADVSWIAGLAALGGGIAYWVMHPAAPAPAESPPAATGLLRFEAMPERGGATFGLAGRF